MNTIKSSKYKGVSWNSVTRAWEVAIYHQGKKRHLGTVRAGVGETNEQAQRRAAIFYDKKRILLGLSPENVLKPLNKKAA